MHSSIEFSQFLLPSGHKIHLLMPPSVSTNTRGFSQDKVGFIRSHVGPKCPSSQTHRKLSSNSSHRPCLQGFWTQKPERCSQIFPVNGDGQMHLKSPTKFLHSPLFKQGSSSSHSLMSSSQLRPRHLLEHSQI